MSQVKNLRAMFESKGDISPPDSRGRSPTGGFTPASSPPYWSYASSSFFSNYMAPASTTSEGPRPLSKIRTNFVAVEKDGRIGLKRDQSGDSSISRRRLSNDAEPSLYRTRSKMSTHEESARNPAAESIPEAPDAAEAAAEQTSLVTADNSLAKPEEATPAKPAASRSITVASKTTTKPAASKTESTKPRTVTKPVATTRATGGVTAAKKPAAVKTGVNDAGFVKPKPKSPTKPVNLPSSLMAPTAASAHKGGASRQSNLPQSASAHAISASAASKPVKRQSSAATRPRPSLGVPSVSKLSQESSSGKRQSHVDEGFLARMMRPTAASSSKTTEKGAPTTPPKKSAPRLSNISSESVKHPAKSPVPNRAASAARSREATSRTEKAPAKPASSIAKAAAVPVAAATAIVAGAAAVGSKVVPDSTASKLADTLQDLGIEEPKEELKQETKDAPETEHVPTAEHEFEAEKQPEPEHQVEAEPEHKVEEVVEDVAPEEVEAEVELDVEPEPEHETLEEPMEESVEEHAEELDTEDTQREVEEEHGTAPAEHIGEPQPLTQEEELAIENVVGEALKEEQPAHEAHVALEELAVEAAQVETSEEVIEIAEEADSELPVSFDDSANPTELVVECPTAKDSSVHNGDLDKAGAISNAEPTSTLPKLAEPTLEHAKHAEHAADEILSKDADTAA